jgi:arylsulfatase A-like enzyme
MGYQAVRTSRWKYIHYTELDGAVELYDLDTDPYEMTNRISDPRAQPALGDLRMEVARLLRRDRRRLHEINFTGKMPRANK